MQPKRGNAPQSDNSVGKYLLVGSLGLAGVYIVKTLLGGGFGGGAKKAVFQATALPSFDILMGATTFSVSQEPTFTVAVINNPVNEVVIVASELPAFNIFGV